MLLTDIWWEPRTQFYCRIMPGYIGIGTYREGGGAPVELETNIRGV